jgi:predicted metal-binding membrane protein
MLASGHLGSTVGDRRILLGAIGLLIGAAWLALWQLDASPYGRYLHHDTPAGLGGPLEAALFVGGWTLMIVAMMLPTTIPLLATFAALVRRRRRSSLLVGLVISGYLVAWAAFGLAAWFGDRVVHLSVDAIPPLAAYPQVILATTLAVAGLYQFSSLKYRCLDECRSPLGFVIARWQGTSERVEALRLGIAHGVFCIGCCWSLMLVMFGAGLGNLAWMFGLAVITSIEKNAPWGRRIGRPLGVALILGGLAVLNG